MGTRAIPRAARDARTIARTAFAALLCAASAPGCRRAAGPPAEEPDWYAAVGDDWPMGLPGEGPGPGFAHRGGAERRVDWPEQAGGVLWMRTNDQGFREDAPTEAAPTPGRPRWIALGDSHTDGVADNADTWPNRLEARLAEAGQPVEVINAGVGYYGPDELQRAGQALLRLRPARLIVAPYLGNDLLDAIVSASREGGPPIPAQPPRAERLAAMAERHPGAVHQALNQDLLLAEHPELVAPACARLAGALRSVWATAAGQGVELWVMPLPPLFDVAHPDAILADAESILGLPRAAVGQHRACAAGLEAAVRAGGPPGAVLRWIDVQPAILAVGAPAYWAADQHLSARGLDAVAEALAEAALAEADGAGAPGR